MPRLFEGNVDAQLNDDHSTDVFCTRERAFERIASILTRKAWARGRESRAAGCSCDMPAPR